MKTTHKIIKYLTLGMIVMFFVFNLAYAIDDYTVLTRLPGIGDTTDGKTTLQTYLPAVFNLMIGIGAVLAFIVITWGGITYATSDAISGKEQGKEWITNAVWGLILVIGAWIILYTINPNILRFDLILEDPDIKPGQALIRDGIPLNATQLINDAEIRNTLRGIVDVNNPPCVTGATRGCTNVNGLPPNAITGLVNLTTDCKCSLTITGGTEGGHKTHGVGKPMVDLRPNATLNKYLTGSTSNPADGTVGKITTLPNGQRIGFVFETLGGNTGGTSTGPHWHVEIR